jgi:acetyltransferase
MAFADATDLIHSVAERFPRKPVVAWLYGPNQHDRSEALEARGRVMTFPTVERAGRALKALWDYRQFRREKSETFSRYRVQYTRAKKRILRSLKNNAPFTDKDLWLVLEAYGIPAVHSEFARNQNEVFAAASKVGYPVVLKVSSPDVNHKSDAGGVALNINNRRGLARAYREMRTNLKKAFPRAVVTGFLVQHMVEGGREIILGAKRDSQFGPVVMFGLGGIHTEVLQDTTYGVSPLRPADARKMLNQIKGAPIIDGMRGEKGLDKGFLVESILRLSQLMVDIPEIKEIDLNPLKVFEKGGVAVDARVLLQ